VGAHSLRRLSGGRYYLILALALLALLAALGGASRADELQQSFVRLAAIVVIAAALWPLDFSAFRGAQRPMIGFGIVFLLLLLQLLPLPFELWARMPGHALYARVAVETHSTGWRPWTLSPDLTLNALAGFLPAATIALLTLALDFKDRLQLAKLVVAIACASALLGLLQFAAGGTTLHLFRTTSENSAVGLFANRNHQAVLMACALPILAAVTSIRMRQEDERTNGLALSAAALLLMGLAATGSRMGLLLGAIGVASAAAIWMVRPEGMAIRRLRSRTWLIGSGVVVAAVGSIALLVARSGSIARLAHNPVDETRIAAIGPILKAVRSFFPFGSGFGTFEPVYRRFEPDSLLSNIYLNQAHNEPLQLALEGGIPALVLLLLFLAWWVHAAFRSVRPRGSASRRAMGIGMTATSLILMLSSLVDYPLRTPLLSSLFAIACVELARSKRRVEAAPPA
jgi:O-antigen ligase